MKGKRYTYVAYFKKDGDGYVITVPDLSGVVTEANSIVEGIDAVKDALTVWLLNAEDFNFVINEPSSFAAFKHLVTDVDFIQYISVDTVFARTKECNKSVKKTLTIPKWLNDLAIAKGVNFSSTLQTALKQELDV